eukprot:scpid23486/ scgid17867/ Ankyrin-1; Ankyrin-R; Erythrocyte ankyrin
MASQNQRRPVRSGAQSMSMSLQRRTVESGASPTIGMAARPANDWRRRTIRAVRDYNNPPSSGGYRVQARRSYGRLQAQHGPNSRFLQRRGATMELLADDWNSEGEDTILNSTLDESGETQVHGTPIDASFFQLKIKSIVPQPTDQRTNQESTPTATQTSSASDATQDSGQNETFFTFSSDDSEPDRDTDEEGGTAPVDYVLQRMIGDKFDVGPRGLTIGSGKGCDVRLPKRTLLEAQHARIEWRSANPSPTSTPPSADGGRARLTLQDLSGGGRFWLSSQPECSVIMSGSADGDQEQQSESLSEPVELCWGAKFSMGRVEFQVVPLPPSTLVCKCLFAAVRNDDATVLSAVLDAAKEPNGLKGAGSACPLLRPNSGRSVKRLDLEITDKPHPASVFDDEEEDNEPAAATTQANSPFAAMSWLAPNARSRQILLAARQRRRAESRYLRMHRRPQQGQAVGLLHVAVDQSNLEIVSLLLSEGAEVNGIEDTSRGSPLQMAVNRDNVEIARLLLQHGARMEVAGAPGHLPFQCATSHKMRKLLLNVPMLCSAAEVGDEDEVRGLLACNTPVNGIGLGNKNSLHFACMSGHTEVVKLLLHAGANVTIKGGSRQRTPLHYAALSGCVDAARCLLDAGAREATRDQLGFTALNLTDKAEMCNLLRNTQSPSLCIAAQGGDIAMARQLLEDDSLHGDEKLDLVNQRNDQRHAAIHLACVAGSIEFIQLLVLYRADVDMPGGSGDWTPLMFAGAAGKAAAVEYLLSIGADQTVWSSSSGTAQDLVEETLRKIKEEEKSCNKLTSDERSSASASSSQPKTSTATTLSAPLIARQTSHPNQDEHRRWLSQRRAQLEAVLGVLRSAPQRLQQALNHNDLETARSLLEDGVVTAQCVFDEPVGGSALYHACSQGRKEFAEMLLDHGASLTAAGEDGLMPAHIAATQGHVETLQLLLDRGQSMDARESTDGNTLLHVAAICNRSAVVQLLLDRGADRTCINNEEKTPFDVAKQVNVLRLLATGTQRLAVEARVGSVARVRSLLESEEDGVSQEDLLRLCGDETPGANPLHEAVRQNHLPVLEVLIDAGCNINATAGTRRETVLHVASRRGLHDIARYLMEHNARVDLKNWLGRTPFEVAHDNSMRKILVQVQRVIQIQAVPDLNDDGIPDDKRCRVCMDKPINTIILPCGHQAFCSDCAGRIKECALDRQPINEIVKVFC